jgi:uncharacterized membrane protein YkoI
MTWRYRCPEGHTTLMHRTDDDGRDYYECESCRKRGDDWKYRHKIDAKTGERVHA